MKRRTAWILVGLVAAVAVGAAVVGGVVLMVSGRAPQFALGGTGLGGKKSLYLSLDGPLPERHRTDIENLLERRPPSLRTMVESLDRAASDPAIENVVVRIDFLPDAGWGKVQELRSALARFQTSGKKATAYLVSGGNLEYYLATACTKIYALPSSVLAITGLSSEVTFLKGTLDKLGVQAQFEGVGRYKNAPNQFLEKGFTEPHREQIEALLDSLFAEYVGAIAKARGMSVEEVRRAIDAGPYDGDGAKAAGLIDDTAYDDELADGNERWTPGRYVRRSKGRLFDSRPKVALIYTLGEIVSGESQAGWGGEVAGSTTIVTALRDARSDPDYKAIVMRVDSPGGSGAASEMMWREMKLASQAKPVIVSMGDMAASGGYYLAMGGAHIIAQPGTVTGSIGVFSGKFSLRGFYDKIGVSKEILDRGRFASIFTEYRPWSAEERARIRALNVAFYDDFVEKVAASRGKSVEEIDAVAEGRVWTGLDANKHGLVDGLGGINEAVAWAKKQAKIPAAQAVELVVLPAERGLLETLWARQEETALDEGLASELGSALRWLRSMSDATVMARLPFDLRLR